MYCNYNVTPYPMKIVTTYPKVVFLLEIPVHQKTHAHKAVIIPPIYPTGILHFPFGQFPVVVGYIWPKVNFRKCKQFYSVKVKLFLSTLELSIVH